VFTHRINDHLELRLYAPHHADEVFAVSSANREHIRVWLPWIDAVKTVDDTREFIRKSLEQYSRDEQYQETIVELCKAIVAEGGYDADPVHLARGLDALLEGLWLRLLMDQAKQARERLRACAAAHLAAVFPRHFSAEGPIGSR
jgi:hypothetical protein